MPVSLRTGEVVHDRYIIKKIIGQGGAGSVYLADDLRLEGRLCAIKEVNYDQTLPIDLQEQARDQFQREAVVLARLDHPNLPKVSDYFSIGLRDYLVMDYVPGDDLRAILLEARRKNQFLEEREILGWANQLAEALSYLHNQNPPILHRDIKPSNLKLMPSGIVKLVDFGLVKVLASEEVTLTIIQGRGTALYTPLEQYGGDAGHTDVRTDIYAFAATLYHLLSGHAPVEARDRYISHGKLNPIRIYNPNISPRTERAVLWGMELHPDNRPTSVEEFRKAMVGGWSPNSTARSELPTLTLVDLVTLKTERILAVIAILLILTSLIITLLQ